MSDINADTKVADIEPTEHSEIMARFFSAQDKEMERRNKSKHDIYFLHAEDQWSEYAKGLRGSKPMFTINKLGASVKMAVGDFINKRMDIVATPVTDISKGESETLNGFLRSIFSTREAVYAQHVSYENVVAGGFDVIEVETGYEHGNPFHQSIFVRSVKDAIDCAWFDPMALDQTGSDGQWQFKTKYIEDKVYRETWPDADSQFPDNNLNKYYECWVRHDTDGVIRVADYYEKRKVEKTLVLLSDGSIITSKAYEDEANKLLEEGKIFVDERKTKVIEIYHYLVSGYGILEGPTKLPTQYLPLVRILGYNYWLDNQLHYEGYIRPGKPSQEIYNYTRSAEIEATALAPKPKLKVTETMIGNDELQYRKINDSEELVLIYEHDPDVPGGPVYINTQAPNTNLTQQAQTASLDMQETIGRRLPSQSENVVNRSGVAIKEVKDIDRGVLARIESNHADSWRHAGQIVADMIPVVITEQRQVSILTNAGKEEIVTINGAIESQDGEQFLLNDANKKYKIKIDVAPSFDSARERSASELALLANDPEMKLLLADLITESTNITHKEEVVKRIRANQIKKGAVEPTEDELKEQEEKLAKLGKSSEEMQQMELQRQQLELKQFEQTVRKAELTNDNLAKNIELMSADAVNKMASANKSNASASKATNDAFIDMVDAMQSIAESGGVIPPELISTTESMLQLINHDLNQELQNRLFNTIESAKRLSGNA